MTREERKAYKKAYRQAHKVTMHNNIIVNINKSSWKRKDFIGKRND